MLLIKKGPGFFPTKCTDHLRKISCCDEKYEEDDTDPEWNQVDFERTEIGETARFLERLIRCEARVHILPVNYCVCLPNDEPITNRAGIAFDRDWGYNPLPGEIVAAYDVSDCGDVGYRALKQGSTTKIANPPAAILYHELSHCLDFILGIKYSEPAATADENIFRRKIDIDLRNTKNRDVCCSC